MYLCSFQIYGGLKKMVNTFLSASTFCLRGFFKQTRFGFEKCDWSESMADLLTLAVPLSKRN